MTLELLDDHVLGPLANPGLEPLDDGAVLPAMEGRPCLTTDAYVVQPLEFPGGDIGRLAVSGTVNDLLMMGARPRALSLALVLEEGLELALLDRVVASIASTAKEAGVSVVTGDTKVIERGRGDGMTITTAGVGELPDSIAEHGMTIMACRESLGIESSLRSDVAPLGHMVDAILSFGHGVKFMRDPTRTGLAGVACDIAEGCDLNVELDEQSIPVTPVVRHTAEALGLDPLTIANEGKVVCVVAADIAKQVVVRLGETILGARAAIIGRVCTCERGPSMVELCTAAGGRRIMQRPYGEELPRIC